MPGSSKRDKQGSHGSSARGTGHKRQASGTPSSPQMPRTPPFSRTYTTAGPSATPSGAYAPLSSPYAPSANPYAPTSPVDPNAQSPSMASMLISMGGTASPDAYRVHSSVHGLPGDTANPPPGSAFDQVEWRRMLRAPTTEKRTKIGQAIEQEHRLDNTGFSVAWMYPRHTFIHHRDAWTLMSAEGRDRDMRWSYANPSNGIPRSLSKSQAADKSVDIQSYHKALRVHDAKTRRCSGRMLDFWPRSRTGNTTLSQSAAQLDQMLRAPTHPDWYDPEWVPIPEPKYADPDDTDTDDDDDDEEEDEEDEEGPKEDDSDDEDSDSKQVAVVTARPGPSSQPRASAPVAMQTSGPSRSGWSIGRRHEGTGFESEQHMADYLKYVHSQYPGRDRKQAFLATQGFTLTQWDDWVARAHRS